MKILNMTLIILLAVSQPVFAKEKTKRSKAVKPVEEVVYLVCECQSRRGTYNGEPTTEICSSKKSWDVSVKNGWEISERSYFLHYKDTNDQDNWRRRFEMVLLIDRISGFYRLDNSNQDSDKQSDEIKTFYSIHEEGQCKKVDGPSL